MKARAALAMSLMLLCACSGAEKGATDEARAVPESQSKQARDLRLPRMRPARVVAQSGAAMMVLRVQVVVEGTLPPDTTVQVRSTDTRCGASFVDTAVVHNGSGVVGALVWVEGTGAVIAPTGVAEFRPTVMMEGCRLQPRVQLAVPGSTIQLVTHDPRVESIVVVPASLRTPIDTIAFNTDGQLVPLRNRADSTGVLGLYATRLPWARAFVAITAPGASAISDATGSVNFTLERTAPKMTIRAWHPALGITSGSITPATGGADATLTLTFRR